MTLIILALLVFFLLPWLLALAEVIGIEGFAILALLVILLMKGNMI